MLRVSEESNHISVMSEQKWSSDQIRVNDACFHFPSGSQLA